MVQSSDNCDNNSVSILNAARSRTVVQNKTVTAYCAALSVQGNAQLLENLTLQVATENLVAKIILEKTFEQFSNKCKDFTLAMSLKHQLQNSLFRKKNQNLSTSDDHQKINRLSSILIYLQTIANSLDDIHSRQQSSHCVRLSAHGYRMMYHVKNVNTPLLTAIKNRGMSWVKNYNKGTKYGPCDCKVLYRKWVVV